MTYYFPIGATESTIPQNINYTSLAISSSAAVAQTISVNTASYALTSGSIPANGTNGTSRVEADCPERAPVGATGATGLRGRKGADVLVCPEGTVECTGLLVSLSAGYNDGVTRGINYYVPSGSQYSIVCMEIPNGCDLINVGCPDYLPIAFPSILPTP